MHERNISESVRRPWLAVILQETALAVAVTIFLALAPATLTIAVADIVVRAAATGFGGKL